MHGAGCILEFSIVMHLVDSIIRRKEHCDYIPAGSINECLVTKLHQLLVIFQLHVTVYFMEFSTCYMLFHFSYTLVILYHYMYLHHVGSYMAKEINLQLSDNQCEFCVRAQCLPSSYSLGNSRGDGQALIITESAIFLH